VVPPPAPYPQVQGYPGGGGYVAAPSVAYLPPHQPYIVTYQSEPGRHHHQHDQDDEHARYMGMRRSEQEMCAWILCVLGWCFFFPWICALPCICSKSVSSRVAGFISLALLIINSIILVLWITGTITLFGVYVRWN